MPSLNCASECFIYYGGTYRYGWQFEYFNRRYDSVTCFAPALTTPGAQFLSDWKRHRQRSDVIKSSLLSQISNSSYHLSRSLFEVELLVLKIWEHPRYLRRSANRHAPPSHGSTHPVNLSALQGFQNSNQHSPISHFLISRIRTDNSMHKN